MGLLRSASSILIAGQNPLNGIWFAMKGWGSAVSHWTRLSLETFIALHPHPLPFTFPSGICGELACLLCPVSPHTVPMVWMGTYMCVRVCAGEEVHEQRWRGKAAVPWEMLFVAYRSTSPSMLSGLDRLRRWKCNLFSCWDRSKWIQSGAVAVLNSPMPRDGLSPQLEQRGVHWRKVWWSLNLFSVIFCLDLLWGLQIVSVWLCQATVTHASHSGTAFGPKLKRNKISFVFKKWWLKPQLNLNVWRSIVKSEKITLLV